MFAYAAGNRIDLQFVIRQRVPALTNRQSLTHKHPSRFSPEFQLNQMNSVNFNLAIADRKGLQVLNAQLYAAALIAIRLIERKDEKVSDFK